MEAIFYNYDPNGVQTFQIRKDEANQLIHIRPFAREGTVVRGISDEFVFDPGALRSHPDHGRFWTDHMCWGIENRENPMVPSYCRAIYPFSPAGAPDPQMRPGWPRWVSIFVPFADSPVGEMIVMCYIGQGLPLIETPARLSDRRVIEREMMPALDLEIDGTCKADAVIRGRIRLRSARRPDRVTVFLDCNAGYLPRREIELIDGVGEFAYRSWGLVVGEKARIEAGFRYYKSKAVAEIATV